MDLSGLNQETALQLIGRLKQGRNVIFGASYFSVGRDQWVKGAEQVFNDVETTGDSMVRFLRGNYGVGKTNFAARLFHSALNRGWVAVYVELSDQVMLHQFHQVFAQVVDKMYAPHLAETGVTLAAQPQGVIGVLKNQYKKIRESMGLGRGADIPATAKNEVSARINTVLQGRRIYGEFASAIRAYFDALIEDDREKAVLIERWMRGDPNASLRGFLKPISKVTGKDHLRSLSSLIVGFGYKGTLIVIDELERIMEESADRRRKSYTILRELIDNVDGENGMRNTCLYAAAPPGQFESQKGFIEVEALASRVQAPVITQPDLTDYTSTIVDLDGAPLTQGELNELAGRIRDIHSVARGWEAKNVLPDAEVRGLVKEIARAKPYSNVRVRDFCVEVTAALESHYQANRRGGTSA